MIKKQGSGSGQQGGGGRNKGGALGSGGFFVCAKCGEKIPHKVCSLDCVYC